MLGWDLPALLTSADLFGSRRPNPHYHPQHDVSRSPQCERPAAPGRAPSAFCERPGSARRPGPLARQQLPRFPARRNGLRLAAAGVVSHNAGAPQRPERHRAAPSIVRAWSVAMLAQEGVASTAFDWHLHFYGTPASLRRLARRGAGRRHRCLCRRVRRAEAPRDIIRRRTLPVEVPMMRKPRLISGALRASGLVSAYPAAGTRHLG